MFIKMSGQSIERTQLFLVVSWLVLIVSLFYDPISFHLTQPGHLFGPSSPDLCFQFQGECRPFITYGLGPRIFWGIIIPLIIISLLIFGHELWRSVCPLSFLSQIPRKLGIQRKYIIQKNTWLGQNHYYLQFGLLFIGLNLRLLLINSDRFLLGIFLLLTIACAIIVGFLWDGKTFCNYFCPFACVEEIFSEPGGVFELETDTKKVVHLSQSGCRKRKKNGRQMSNCVGCKSHCIDIDPEASYWNKINQPDRKLIYYSYVGLVTGFYIYFWLCSGDWNFITEGLWNETSQLDSLLSPGFYILDHLIFIPKLIAVPLTLLIFSLMTYHLGISLEKIYKRCNTISKKCLDFKQIQHQLLTIFAFVAFNIIFFVGTLPAFNWLPLYLQNLLTFIVLFMGCLWFIKNWGKSLKKYINKKRKLLPKSYHYSKALNKF